MTAPMTREELLPRLRHMAKLVGFDLTPLLNEAADEIERLRTGVAQTSGWQPIETAPKDNGVCVIVWDDPVMGEAYYDPGERSWWWTNTGPGEHTSEAIYPTLWQPMPAPPSNQGASK